MEDLLPVIAGTQARKVYREGDLEAGVVSCGQVVALINRVQSVGEVIEGIVGEAMEIRQRLNGIISV